MKKISAFLAIAFMILALSACSASKTYWEYDIEHHTDKADTQTEYYSALNVEVVSYAVEEGTCYELQIGLRDFSEEMPLNETQAKEMALLLKARTDKTFDFVGFFKNYGEDYYDDYTYYCFLATDGKSNLSSIGVDYGFFYVKQDLALNIPQWLYDIKQHVISVSDTALSELAKKEGYTIDKDSINLRYYLVTDESLKAKNATHVYKTLVSMDGYTYKSLMWQAETVSDFDGLPLEYSAMAPGWYIIPIIVGTLCVVILICVCKYRKPVEDIFRKDEAFSKENRDNVLDGQISMDDIKRGDTEDKNG